ncbi:MAG: hypothetical protein ACRDNW_18185 [Trebonia sp.]
MLEEIECTDDQCLFEYLTSGPGNQLDPDVRHLFMGLIGKCPEWDDAAPVGRADVTIDGGEPATAFSAEFALLCASRRQGVACPVFGACPRRQYLPVRSPVAEARVFFFAYAAELKTFWRSLYLLEAVGEAAFFSLAARSFPDLVFHPDLNLGRFEGSYRDLLPEVVRHLSVLNDHFLDVHQAKNGLPHDIEAALGALGCAGISPESPNTHRDEKKMRSRDVHYEGETLRCEWHSKLEPHRNRIHFYFGGQLGDKVLIGIFVDHLPT